MKTITTLERILLIIGLTAMWSPSYLFIKLAIEDFPPFTLVAFRVLLAAILLYFFLLYRKEKLPKDYRFWMHTSILSFFSAAAPYTLFSFAEQAIDSTVAAILSGGATMFTAFLAHLFLPSDRMTVPKFIGVSLTVFGLLLLFSPSLVGFVSSTTIGMLAAVGATLCYGISHVYAKKYTTGQTPLVMPTAQFVCCTVMMLPLAIAVDKPMDLPIPSISAMIGVGGLTIFGTVIAYIIYFRLMEHCGAVAVSMVSCCLPVFGILLGFIFLQESLSWQNLVASGIIIVGMMLVNGILNFKDSQNAS